MSTHWRWPPDANRALINIVRAERAMTRSDYCRALALAMSAHLQLPQYPSWTIDVLRRRLATILPEIDSTAIVRAMDDVEGWLTPAEAALLARATAHAIREGSGHVVEIGSFCGRSTVTMALTIKSVALDQGSRLIAIDPHEGYSDASGRDTYELLSQTLCKHNVEHIVDIIRARSTDVALDFPICMIFIDGLHDASSVCADRDYVIDHIRTGSLLAFHDYRPDFPGVVKAVQDVLLDGHFDLVGFTGSLLVVCRH
ncbi:class I SAM-dependent methyltransferase [Microvirga massiliensis]|uniref:class I SAM-dependent methyltransferase n=1 Tax=Microvirga massiliensis TaxID=1033741 RepID=UPI00062B7398|nr:class I SAM-dependent methyltransferase [Microvirga massiliensis]